jgi:hypothetical protein
MLLGSLFGYLVSVIECRNILLFIISHLRNRLLNSHRFYDRVMTFYYSFFMTFYLILPVTLIAFILTINTIVYFIYVSILINFYSPNFISYTIYSIIPILPLF